MFVVHQSFFPICGSSFGSRSFPSMSKYVLELNTLRISYSPLGGDNFPVTVWTLNYWLNIFITSIVVVKAHYQFWPNVIRKKSGHQSALLLNMYMSFVCYCASLSDCRCIHLLCSYSVLYRFPFAMQYHSYCIYAMPVNSECQITMLCAESTIFWLTLPDHFNPCPSFRCSRPLRSS